MLRLGFPLKECVGNCKAGNQEGKEKAQEILCVDCSRGSDAELRWQTVQDTLRYSARL